MERIRLSSWRTLVWGRGMVTLFVLVGLIPLTVVTFLPDRFDWFGGPRPWYVPLIVLILVVAVVAFVARATGDLRAVSVEARSVIVSRWLGEVAYPLASVRSLRVDRERRLGGQSPVVLELAHEGGSETVSFLVAESLHRDDVARLLGVPADDSRDRDRGRSGRSAGPG